MFIKLAEREGFVLHAALDGGSETWHFPFRSLIPLGRECRSLFLAPLGGKRPFSSLPMFC
jgi:hypothetical protein